MLIAFLMNIVVVATSMLLIGRFFASENSHYRLLALSVFIYAQIVFIQLFWGVLGKLYLVNVVLSALLFFLICSLLFRRTYSALNLFKISNELLTNKVALLCLSILLGFGIVKTAINLVNPPFGWDSLNYHFTFPVEWLKQANLQNPITINDDLGPSYYPINGSLIYLWFIFPLKNVFLADLGQIPLFVISFLAVYGICRQLNIGKEYSFYGAGIFTITPNYFKQMEIAYVDVMVCAWFLVSFYFLLLFYYQKRLKDVVPFAVSAGLLAGTKTTALPYAAVLFAFFFFVCLRYFKAIGLPKILYYTLLAISLLIICGGYSYIRNFYQTGNPFYPLNVQFLGLDIFKGVYDKANYSVRVNPYDYAPSKILFHEGMGAGLIVFVIPGLLFFILMMFRKRQSLDKALIFITPLFLFLIWRSVIPLANLRYLYPALALGYIVPFSILSANKPYKNFARILVILCFVASCAEIANHLELVFSLLFSIILFFSLVRIYALLSKFKIRHWLMIISASILTLYILNIDYNKNEYKRYIKMVKYSGLWPEAAKAWNWLNENTTGNNIAYVGRPVPLPLYGTNFKNNVFYASVNEVDPVRVHYFHNSYYRWGADFLELHKSLEAEGNYRQHPDYDVWLSNLKRRRTDYLFVYSLHQTKEIIFPIEDAWAKEHSDKFLLSLSSPIVHIYKII